MTDSLYWQYLENEISPRVAAFPGVAGFSVRNLADGAGFSVHGDQEFPIASTIKIFVLARLLQRAELGELDLNQVVSLSPAEAVPGSGVLTYLEGGVSLSLLNLAILMILVSDNTATNLCIDLAGMAETNQLIRQLGLSRTVLRRKMQDQAAVARGDENISTPDECVKAMQALYQGQPTPWVAGQCLSILKKTKKGLFNTAIPGIPVANKPGGMDRIRCDAGSVYLKRRPYAMSILTSYSILDPVEQERYVIDLARAVHKAMATLDGVSAYGQGLVA